MVEYRITLELNCIVIYHIINLRSSKLKSSQALPIIKSLTKFEISGILEVKGATTEASASESDKPTSALF